MKEEKIIVIAEESGERIDALLARKIEGLSRSAAQRLIESESVTINGAPVKKNRRTAEGEPVEVAFSEASEPALEAQEIPLDVFYEDDDVIVVNKPRGMVVHPAPGHAEGTLVNELMHRCG
ncbi:MAG: RNA pseudouridine synthase, partial [Clostridia bacterium]|nr:RNA pseudouridine synthase [Clostridia bacterium]